MSIGTKLNVFVSSAMGTEYCPSTGKVFDWDSFRKSLRDKLNQCPYINTFIIEDRASTMRSNDFMISKIDASDMVVLLVMNELRKGTSIEYTHCIKTKKPLLIFFFGKINPQSEAESLCNKIKETDYCTFTPIDDVEKAEIIITNNVIEDVIFYYSSKHRIVSTSQSIDIAGIPVETEFDNKSYIPTKTILSQFKTSYESIYKYIGLSNHSNQKGPQDQSNLHSIGEQVIKWVITGEHFLSSDIKSTLVSSVTNIYPKSDWYSKRLDAIDFFIQGDIIQAFRSEKEALKLAEEANLAEWIKTNILIDLRNLQDYIPKDLLKTENLKYQKRLDSLDSIIHIPVLDKYLKNAYDILLNEETKRNTASAGTIFFGNNLDEIIIYVENYLFSSLLYGSNTHMMNTRTVLANIFYRTGKLYNCPELLYYAIKMYLFAGQYENFIRISNLEWNKISNILILNADELWHQAQNIHEISKDLICLGILHRVGLYLNDHSFNEAENYLLELSCKLSYEISENYIDCLLSICERIDQKIVVKILISIIDNQVYGTANHLTQLINYIDIQSVPDELLDALCQSIKKGLPNMVKRNGDPQCIASLVNARPDIFSVLEKLPNNGLKGRQKLIYALNTSKGDWQDILLSELQVAEKQFRAKKLKGIYYDYITNPFFLISLVFENNPSNKIINNITENLFPLCIDILNSECPLEIKDHCAECLCTALGYYKKNGILIPNTLIDCIKNVSLKNSPNYTISLRSSGNLLCRIILLKILAGVLDKQVLIQWCFSYWKKDVIERRTLVKCLKIYLQYSIDEKNDIDALIISIVFQCCEDQDVYIRVSACECLWYILESQYSEQTKEKIYEMTLDPAPAIKRRLLEICKEKSLIHRSLINKIIIRLINDSNYIIREQAKELLETILKI